MTKQIYDSDLLALNNQAANVGVDIDPFALDKAKETLDALEKQHKEGYYYGGIYHFNGLDVPNLKHPFFEK